MKPKVITLCGSSRFVDIMATVGWLLERDEGAIAMGLHLMPIWYTRGKIPNHLAEHEGVSEQMDKLHLCKIDLSDEIFVVNRNDYIGESTKKEIKHAESKSLPIRWYTSDPIGKKVEGMIRDFLAEQDDPVLFRKDKSEGTDLTITGKKNETGNRP